MKMHTALQALAGLVSGAHAINGTMVANSTVMLPENMQVRQCLIAICSQMCTGMSKRDGAQMSVACRICLVENASARKCQELSVERPTQDSQSSDSQSSYGSNNPWEEDAEEDYTGPMYDEPALPGQSGREPGPEASESTGKSSGEPDPVDSTYDQSSSREQEPQSGSKNETQHNTQARSDTMPEPQRQGQQQNMQSQQDPIPQDQQHDTQPQQNSTSQPQPQPPSGYEGDDYPSESPGDENYSDGSSDKGSGGSYDSDSSGGVGDDYGDGYFRNDGYVQY